MATGPTLNPGDTLYIKQDIPASTNIEYSMNDPTGTFTSVDIALGFILSGS